MYACIPDFFMTGNFKDFFIVAVEMDRVLRSCIFWPL